jgi:hypothetical protein
MVGGSLRVLRLLPPLKLVAMNDIAEILLKVALKHQKSKSNHSNYPEMFLEMHGMLFLFNAILTELVA